MEAVRERIATRMEVLKHELSNVEERTPIVHPAMDDVYAREIRRLRETLNEEAHREEAAALIRGLIERIVLTPSTDGERLVMDLEGDLACILAVAARRGAQGEGYARRTSRRSTGSGGSRGKPPVPSSRDKGRKGRRHRWLRGPGFAYSSRRCRCGRSFIVSIG